MAKNILHILIIFFFVFNLSAQTRISGTVKNNKDEGLIVNITLQAQDSPIISGFAITNNNGYYAINYSGNADSLIVTASGMMIGKQSRIIANKTDIVDFNIEETIFSIEEVNVKAPKISMHGDTVNYMVSSFSDQSDRVIGDVLKKMPGIKVSDNGTISYNGKDINKFYIENLDLLQGRYGIATNNIAAKDVATVQVLENHQPIKSLKDNMPSEDPAINLKLKEDAKNTWAITGLAGLGYKPLLWEAELLGMCFGKTKQNITTYKGNNTGKDILSEFKSHYDYERVNIKCNNMLSVQGPSSPPISEKRYVKSRTNAITSNQLFKLNDDVQLNINALFYNDRREKEGYSRNEQFITDDSILTIEEQVSAVSKTNNAEIALRLNCNDSIYYFNNALNIKGNWNNTNGCGNTYSSADNTSENISQYLNKPTYSVDNTMSWIKTIRNNSLKAYFSMGYSTCPQELKVSPANYLYNGSYSILKQAVWAQNVASIIRVSYGYKWKNLVLDYNISESINLENLQSELYRTDLNNNQLPLVDSLNNDLWYNTYITVLNQGYTYRADNFKVSFSIPITYYVISIDDRIPNTYKQYQRWIFTPSFGLSYEFLFNWKISTWAKYNQAYGNMNDAYTGYFMSNYRSLQRNVIDELYEARSGNTGCNLNYKNPLLALFGNLSFKYNMSWRNLLYGYSYQGIMAVKTTSNDPTESRAYSINGDLQKGLDFMSATIRLNGGYNNSKSELLIQDERYESCSDNYSAGINISIAPITPLSIVYTMFWNQRKSYTIGNESNFSPIQSISQNGKINIFPCKAITLCIKGEHSYNSAAIKSHTYFADASIVYKKEPLDLELEVNNVFNSKQYVSASYNDINAYYYSYQLRPLSVLIRVRFKIK